MRKHSPGLIVALVTFCIGVSVAGLWIVGLRSQPRSVESASAVDPKVPADTLITLQRTGCYGLCPSYTLTVAADGTVVFNATSYWIGEIPESRHKESGVVMSRISQEQMRQLISAFEEADYFTLRDSYVDGEGCPGGIATDAPSAYTSIQINGRRKAISHYLACLDKSQSFKVYPPELLQLEVRIDEIVSTKQWMQ